MVLYQADSSPFPDPDDSTAYTATTPPETFVADFLDDHDPLGGLRPSSSTVPWPGSTFIIRSISSGNVLTLLNGQVLLIPPGGRGSMHWACVESKGWLGFKNVASNGFLGHDKRGNLCCVADRHQGWENFCVRLRPDGGYLLLMTHFERLWQVGLKLEQGEEKLAKIEMWGDDGIVWEFVNV